MTRKKLIERVAKRSVLDFFETSTNTLDYLYYNYLKDTIKPKIFQDNYNNNVILDFSCGEGSILKYLTAKFPYIETHGSDIFTGYKGSIGYEEHNMFDYNYVQEVLEYYRGKNIYIIMNPPFNKSVNTLSFYLELYRNSNIKALILLRKVADLSGCKRRKLIRELGAEDLIISMPNRPEFKFYGDEDTSFEKPLYFKSTFDVIWSIWDSQNINDTAKLLYSELIK